MESGNEYVILVNERDEPRGFMEKLPAHKGGKLHRAFSVFIFNSKGEMLLQQRAAGKYHSALLWSNACCSHPAPYSDLSNSAVRRLEKEMGIICQLKPAFHFTYKAELENGITEHEFDHVFVGVSDETPSPDKNEVENWRWISIEELVSEITKSPEKFTEWFRICYVKAVNSFNDIFHHGKILQL